jgi:hypothetical protein
MAVRPAPSTLVPKSEPAMKRLAAAWRAKGRWHDPAIVEIVLYGSALFAERRDDYTTDYEGGGVPRQTEIR